MSHAHVPDKIAVKFLAESTKHRAAIISLIAVGALGSAWSWVMDVDRFGSHTFPIGCSLPIWQWEQFCLL